MFDISITIFIKFHTIFETQQVDLQDKNLMLNFRYKNNFFLK